MRVSSRLFRASVWLASTSLSLSSTLPAMAQPAPPDQNPPPQAEGAPAGDPPAIAGRVSVVSGTVSFHAAGDTTWNAASLNYPVTNGDGFWTEPSAHAELQVGDDRVVLAGSTEFEIGALDSSQISATEAQGASFLQIQSLPQGQTLTVNTPRGAVQINTPGRYEVVAGDTNDATTVTVVEGAAHVQGNGVSLDVGPEQTATIGGTDTFDGQVGAMQQDEFLQTELKAAQQVQQRVSSLPKQVQYMTGGAELAQYGSFQSSTQYGQVWYPRDVPADWAPYREGHWAYVAPWGWNWVDNEPWGFAPSHYGRWIQDGGRWGWCAGDPADNAGYEGGGGYYGGGYPVYSPALVSFGGIGGALLAGAAIGFAAGAFSHGGGGIGWVPLGYNEPYYPPYRVSNRYFQSVNRYSVTNIRTYNVTNVRNVSFNSYRNARYATVMPEGAMVRGERVGQFGRPLPASAFNNVRPIYGREPVRPNAETPLLSRAAARRFNLPVRAEAGRGAPGPAIAERAAERGRGPALRTAPPPPNVRAVPAASVVGRGPAGQRPGEAGRPPAIGERAGGLPALRAPGAARPPTATPAVRNEPGRAGEPQRPGEANRPGAITRPGEAARPGGAPGPHIGERAGSAPALRAPGADRPEAGRAPNLPAVRTPDRAVEHPGETHAAEPRAQPHQPAVSRTEAPRSEAPRAQTPRPEEHRAEPVRAAPRHEAPHPEPRIAAPRMEAPRPAAPRPEAPRPAPRPEVPRPAPRPEAPRPAPHAEAPHPAPHPAGKPGEKH